MRNSMVARMMDKSNRDVEAWNYSLSVFKVSYTIERLYSDEEVKMVLHNLLILLLKEEEVSGSFAGDGTAILFLLQALQEQPQEGGKGYSYVFRFIDLDTGMYVVGWVGLGWVTPTNQRWTLSTKPWKCLPK